MFLGGSSSVDGDSQGKSGGVDVLIVWDSMGYLA